MANSGLQLARYSFSGADARAYTKVSGYEGPTPYKEISSLHTISVSIHEAKAQVRSLGLKSIKGMTKGIRTIAGSLILTVINDNPMRPFFDNDKAASDKLRRGGWSLDSASDKGFTSDIVSSVRLASTLFPVDIMILYVAEIPQGLATVMEIESSPGHLGITPGNKKELKFDVRGALIHQVQAPIEYCRVLIRGVEFVDEGIVTSSNDLVTEITLSFIAREVVTLENLTMKPNVEENYSEELQAALSGSDFDEYSYYNGLILNKKNQIDTANRKAAVANNQAIFPSADKQYKEIRSSDPVVLGIPSFWSKGDI